jgi:hypothetical protein
MTDAVQRLERELREIFGQRLTSLVAYGSQGPTTHTLAIVEGLTKSDLDACAGKVAGWHDAQLSTPLVLGAHEFEQSLDAFPLEFGAILATHTIVAGRNPFTGLTVDAADVRRACEVQARSHLLHLREGFLETRGRADALAVLIVRSAAAFAALVTSIARLEGHAAGDAATEARHMERTLVTSNSAVSEVAKLAGAHDIPSAEAERLFGPYLDAVERLVKYADGWTRGQ